MDKVERTLNPQGSEKAGGGGDRNASPRQSGKSLLDEVNAS